MKTFPGFRVVNGYHCITSASRKIYLFNNYEISEEALLGLGSGMGFIYWHQKGALPFLGGRGNNKNFYETLGKRTGVKIKVNNPTNAGVAEKKLLATLKNKQPVVVYTDMAYLPYFDISDEHFGEHTVVIAGYDHENEEVIVSDNDPKMTGEKKAILFKMPLKQLTQARDSAFKPFPAKNRWLSYDFSESRRPGERDFYEAIEEVTDAMLNPPIKNIGVEGIRTAAKRIKKWPESMDKNTLRASLFNIYIFVEIGGTGGGLFRKMYGRFLKEAASVISSRNLEEAGKEIEVCGNKWSKLAQPLKKSMDTTETGSMIERLIVELKEVAEMEEKALSNLKEICGAHH